MQSKNNYNILVIDDVVSIHQDFRKILTPEANENYGDLDRMTAVLSKKDLEKQQLPPFELKFASQSLEGISLVKEALLNNKPFAVVFVDVQMPPGDDGIETIRRIWEIDHEIQTVICTAYATYTWEDLQRKFGETDRLFILKKPFDNLEIIQMASTLCKKWNLNRQLQSPGQPPQPKLSTIENDTMERLNSAMDILSELNSKLKKNEP